MEHQHQHEHTKSVVNRLARAEGHMRAIRRMVEEGAPCPDVLVQLAAVKGAVDRVARLVLSDHMESCLRNAAQGEGEEVAWQDFKQALDRYIG